MNYRGEKKDFKNRSKKKTGILVTVTMIVGIVLAALLIKIVPAALGIGLLVSGAASAKPEVYRDISDYQQFIGPKHLAKYLFQDPCEIFPQELADAVVPVEFQFVYYNPWDAQYVTYLTLQYRDEEYEKELERLSAIGIEDYTSFYSVTGEPEGYNLVAMDADKYYGFIYAMIPEKADGTITYAGIQFCNYFLDLDIQDYLPGKYLLSGFDASIENPYRGKMMQKH